jgi:hypothetical protein
VSGEIKCQRISSEKEMISSRKLKATASNVVECRPYDTEKPYLS